MGGLVFENVFVVRFKKILINAMGVLHTLLIWKEERAVVGDRGKSLGTERIFEFMSLDVLFHWMATEHARLPTLNTHHCQAENL